MVALPLLLVVVLCLPDVDLIKVQPLLAVGTGVVMADVALALALVLLPLAEVINSKPPTNNEKQNGSCSSLIDGNLYTYQTECNFWVSDALVSNPPPPSASLPICYDSCNFAILPNAGLAQEQMTPYPVNESAP